MKKSARYAFSITALFCFTLSVASTGAYALRAGTKINNVIIKDANNKPAKIPAIGTKVVAIFYTDPDVADQNDAFADLLKAQKLDPTKYKGVGIANLDETWKPNALIRLVIRRKIAKYKATILTDPDKLLQKAWGLGNCNEKSVIMVIGKDNKVYYIKKGAMNAAERQKTLKLIKELMEK